MPNETSSPAGGESSTPASASPPAGVSQFSTSPTSDEAAAAENVPGGSPEKPSPKPVTMLERIQRLEKKAFGKTFEEE